MKPEIQERKFKIWRDSLLDGGKRNRMINYKKSQRKTLLLAAPGFEDLFQRLAVNEETIAFRKRVETGSDIKMTQLFYLMDRLAAPVELAEGEITSDLSIDEMAKTLKELRSQAKIYQEEQGINVLYLSFGFLQWRQKPSDDFVVSPLVLIPVSLELESLTSPYRIKKIAEDIIINPTLDYVLSSDFGIQLPELDSGYESITAYLNQVQKTVQNAGWRVIHEANLGLLPFLKIVMYKDLEKYKERIFTNPVIQAFCGDPSALPTFEVDAEDFDHDSILPQDIHEVVSADSSQKDAIMRSKQGLSFVLQGPPGTGKSQTITNIIAEALADGKRVLFVSEKMAALSVVYKRLMDVGLGNYCLSLHNYKADKKGVIQDLITTLDAPRKSLRAGTSDVLDQLEDERVALNTYFRELNKMREPLNRTVYDVITELAVLEVNPLFKINKNLSRTTEQEYRTQLLALKNYQDFMLNLNGPITDNPWRNSTIVMVTYGLRNEITETLSYLGPLVFGIKAVLNYQYPNESSKPNHSWNSFWEIVTLLEKHKAFNTLDERIRSFYNGQLTQIISPHVASEICDFYHTAYDSVSRLDIKPDQVRTAEHCKELITSLTEDLQSASSIKSWITSLNEAIGTHFEFDQRNYSYIVSFLKDAFSFELFEIDWFSSGKYEKAKEVAVAAEKTKSALLSTLSLFGTVATEKLYGSNTIEVNDHSIIIDHLVCDHGDDDKLLKAIADKVSSCYQSGVSANEITSIATSQKTISALSEECRKLCEIISFIEKTSSALGITIPTDTAGLDQIQEFAGILMLPHQMQANWFEGNQYSHIQSVAASEKSIALKIRELKAQIDSDWSSAFYGINATEYLGRFRTDYTSFFKRLGKSYKNDKRELMAAKKGLSGKLDDSVCVAALEKLQEYQALLLQQEQSAADSRRLFDSYYHGAETDWDVIECVLSGCEKVNEYAQKYGISEKEAELLNSPFSSRRQVQFGDYRVEDATNSGFLSAYIECAKHYEKSLYSVKDTIQKRIEMIQSLLKECEAIKSFIASECKAIFADPGSILLRDEMPFDHYVELLQKHRELCQAANDYQQMTPEIISHFPHLYIGISTNWGEIIKGLELSIRIPKIVERHSNSATLKNWLQKPLAERKETIIGSESLRNFVEDGHCNQYSSFFIKYPSTVHKTIPALKEKIAELESLRDCSEQAAKCFITDFSENETSIQIAFLKKFADMNAAIEHIKSVFAEKFLRYEIHIESELDNIVELYEEYISDRWFEEDVDGLFHVFQNSDVYAIRSVLEKYVVESHTVSERLPQYARFLSWFEDGEFENCSIDELDYRIEACKDLESLNSWISYSALRKKCVSCELAEYLNYVTDTSLPPRRIVSAYKKSFLSRWLMDIIVDENITSFIEFQPYAHEKTIERFKLNSKKQLKLAQARLEADLSQKKPSGVNRMANALDEITILRRESEKKRNIMPVRKLFKAIPNLLQKLKPCFMMSPLSVSYFLDSDMYEFDMVVFDEASQILPEDAIGAIYRGKQVIIAGDTKQMPPSNFFSTSKMDSDYDARSEDDEDWEYDEVSESILDEANSSHLPSSTLLWHYRSRDESLIAFSNREIYGNRLITFPNCTRDSDHGLEYVFVPNGCYENQSNKLEAKKCVQLVAEHIKKHPNRSLGIIAFSKQQQGVIEDAIHAFRMKNPQFEDFFTDVKEEPFFVKNLENVQGDERDTIIFSICYGKNKLGRMYNRFGPLTREGGERRLNVAITRAKYNVKLVGSIMPSDITISPTTKDGVRLLREYIYYALQNDSNVPLETDTDPTGDEFVDIVADFILDNGFRIKRNVGASQYKVDIAVFHPDSGNEFFAGIECDGRNYMSARTANDRDVLRKDIMTSMGWNLHHVWAINWYKNPVEEKKRLLDFLKQASQKFLDGKSQTDNTSQVIDDSFLDELFAPAQFTTETDTTSEVHQIQFAKYTVCDPWNAPSGLLWDNYTRLASRIRYVLEHEAPIHHELLYKRLATVFGNQKATAPVKRTIDDCMQSNMSGEYFIRDDFVYLTNNNAIEARVPASDLDSRPIEYICTEEIQDAMVQIVKFALGLEIEDLLSETARIFGFSRTGPKIKHAMSMSLDMLLKAGKLKESSGKIYPKEE